MHSGTLVNLGIWVDVESNIGIVCACLPTLRPLLHRALNILSDISGSGSSSGKRRVERSPSRETPASAGPGKGGANSSYDSSGSSWSGKTKIGTQDVTGVPGNRALLATNNSSRSQPGWYTNVMASMARVDRDMEMRSQQDWIKLREQQNMV